MSALAWVGVGVLIIGSLLGFWILAIRGQITWAPPNGDSRALTLHVRVSGKAGPAVVLLHGLAGSGRYFGAHFDDLSDRYRVIVPDLLGFGQSPRPPDARYDVNDHIKALVQTLDELGIKGHSVIVGHSTGCVLALALAQQRPERVSSVVAFCPPFYEDTESATERIGAISQVVKMFALDTPLARAACRWMCNNREAAGAIAPMLRPDLPAPIARDGVQHSWASYSGTLKHVVLQGHASVWIPQLEVPVRMIAGELDPVTDLALLSRLAESNPAVSLEIWPGDHDLPLRTPDKCVQALERALVDSALSAPGHG